MSASTPLNGCPHTRLAGPVFLHFWTVFLANALAALQRIHEKSGLKTTHENHCFSACLPGSHSFLTESISIRSISLVLRVFWKTKSGIRISGVKNSGLKNPGSRNPGIKRSGIRICVLRVLWQESSKSGEECVIFRCRMFLKSVPFLLYMTWPDAWHQRLGVSSSKGVLLGTLQKINENSVFPWGALHFHCFLLHWIFHLGEITVSESLPQWNQRFRNSTSVKSRFPKFHLCEI